MKPINYSIFGLFLAVAAAIISISTPVNAQLTAAKSGYSVIDAKRSDKAYEYLTIDSVKPNLSPELTKLLPDPNQSKLVILIVRFKTNGDPEVGNELDPSDLEVLWQIGNEKGKSPGIGVHIAKDFIVIGRKGFYVTMRPSEYEVFFIVPVGIDKLDLAHRQADGTLKAVKPNIELKKIPKANIELKKVLPTAKPAAKRG